MRNTTATLATSIASIILAGSATVAWSATFPQAAPPVTTPPATAPTTPAPATTPTVKEDKPSGKVAPLPPPPKTPTKKTPAAKKAAEEAKPPAETPATVPAPVAGPREDLPPEMQKFVKLAASPKFKEFTKLAAERQVLYKKSSALRMAMRATEPTEAQVADLAKVNADIGKMGDRMDTFGSAKTWTQEDYMTMDFIVSEQMRLNPLE